MVQGKKITTYLTSEGIKSWLLKLFFFLFFYFQPLPELPRIQDLFSLEVHFQICLMVVQFLRNFGKVLGFDVNIDVPNLSVLQEGLLNIGDMGEVQDFACEAPLSCCM